ncbi:hypothetical protein L1D14_19690 [Vibrio tubiashii]|uniref:hypothetical protein n=1 Tax=Vibrio tubiashii TaxID=29498 RepID=UPI001EFDEAAC|nr:hypothetical protein [Vibrio tubiashii]MCG9578445.1 hypothetical protein [Vibrio tubiashii]
MERRRATIVSATGALLAVGVTYNWVQSTMFGSEQLQNGFSLAILMIISLIINVFSEERLSKVRSSQKGRETLQRAYGEDEKDWPSGASLRDIVFNSVILSIIALGTGIYGLIVDADDYYVLKGS